VLAGLSSRKDSIFNVAHDALNKAMFGLHPYGRLVEGDLKTVGQFRKSDIIRWHESGIRPDEAILSCSGPMTVSEARRVIEKHLGGWRLPSSSYRRKPVPSPLGPDLRRGDILLRSTFEQAYLMVGFPAPSLTDPDHLPLKVLNTVLGGGMSSRLFEKLREESGLAYEVSSFYPTRLDPSQWVFYLGLPKEKLKTASIQLDKLLDDLAKTGPTLEEVKQAKAMIRGAFLMDRQSHRRQSWYAAWWQFLGRGMNYGEEFLRTVDAVTPKQLHLLAQRILLLPRTTVRVIPK
jgi:zinc protease